MHVRDILCIGHIDIRICFLRNNDFTETVEIVKQGLYIAVSQLEHSMMGLKTTYCMRTVTVSTSLSTDHPVLLYKNA